MAEFYLISGALLMSAAIVAAFRWSTAAAVAAYAGAWALRASGYAPISANALMFWAVAVLLVSSIDMARRRPVEISRRLRCFIVGGALAGAPVGVALWSAGAIPGAAVGACLGAVAFMGVSRTRAVAVVGRALVTVGLPTVVTMSLVAIGVTGLLAKAL